MTVAEVLAMRQRWMDEPAIVEGHLIVTRMFSYLVTAEDDALGVLVNEHRLADKLGESVPVLGGSMVMFSGAASVEGVLRIHTALPMFPAVLHSVRSVVYRQPDYEPVRLELA
jgi:hypothetical protein